MAEGPTPEGKPRALRVLIEYDGKKLAVAGRQEVETATPPSDPVRGYEGESGFWFEVRGRQGKVLYRRVLENPIRSDVEAHDPEAGTRRYEVARPKGVFVLLVPDLPDAESLVVVSSPLDVTKRAAAAEPLARIPLGKAGKGRAR